MIKPYRRAELNFEIIEDIGEEGKNSEVYRAFDPQLDSEVVIKQLEKRKFYDPDEYFDESSKLYLGRHPNVVQVLYACQDENNIYIAMPYYEKGSLKSKLDDRFLTVREIVKYSIEFISGLHNIHVKNLIHFDVKPDNVMLNNRGEAILSDFGLVKHMNMHRVAEQDRWYTKMKPPEAYGDNEFSIAYDIYQVGLTMYRMCFGDEEYYRQFDRYINGRLIDRHGFRHDILNGQFPNRESGNFFPHIPIPLKQVVRRCLVISPEDRYSSLHIVINDLSNIGGNILDWQRIENDNHYLYRKNNNGKEIIIKIFDDGHSEASKDAGSGHRRITDYCKPDINYQEIYRFLNNY